MRIAVLSAALNGDNSGDAIIETAVRRLLRSNDIKSFPLTYALTEDQINEINTFDKLIICGTNLYQHVFACNLNEEVVSKIKIPIIPFGIGSSAAIGSIPVMREEDVRTVRAIHRTCAASSVRDMASYKFLKSIGVENVYLTGCPVLFHGLSRPEFNGEGEGYTLTPRARLLHIEDVWEKRQYESLEILCEKYSPTLVLQSPYDIPWSDQLSKKYALPVLMDEQWQADKYIELAKTQKINLGFRLHFAMLSISYGKPAFLVSHDSRASEFCELINIPLIDLQSYSDNLLELQIDSLAFNSSGVQKRWDELSLVMNEFMSKNDLPSNLKLSASKKENPGKINSERKPKILLLVDKRNWAFDHSAQHIARQLKDSFDFEFAYVAEQPQLDPGKYDLMYVFFWGEDYYKKFGFRKEQIVKELSSHRWEDNPLYGPCTPTELHEKYLKDSETIICTSKKLRNIIKDIHPNVLHTPNGYDHATFKNLEKRKGKLKIGWAGNIKDSVKGFNEFIKPACERSQIYLVSAPGDLSHQQMNKFYNSIDVFAVSSKNEGEPLTLIESMAAGCFPVCYDVGIVRELIRDKENGIILKDRSIEAFKNAFDWCEQNIEYVRKKGAENALFMLREREWSVCAQFFKYAFENTLHKNSSILLRNDDVSFDTNMDNFRKFCSFFTKNGFKQIHGVTINGNTNTLYKYNNDPVEYENKANISTLSYDAIVELSSNKNISSRTELIKFLNDSRDEVALHGLYHTDYSKMSETQQREDISRGLAELGQLFPLKKIEYFIPPFNRTNDATYKVCADLGLKVLGKEGIHLEEAIAENKLHFNTSVWYRYHHHRFYPETAFTYYKLSLSQLERSLGQYDQTEPQDWGMDFSYFKLLYPSLRDKKPRRSFATRVRTKISKLIRRT